MKGEEKGASGMYVTEQFNLYQLAYHLVMNEQFQILHMNSQTDEIWLEKQNRNQSTIVRFIHKGFDWKNHLKSDIATVFHRVKTMMRFFVGKKIEVYNLYVTEHEPVDDWETLKKPMLLKAKKPVHMNVFYLSEENFNHEQSRFFEKIDLHQPKVPDLPNPETQEDIASTYKQKLSHLLYDKAKAAKDVFNYGKPRFVYLMLLVNILMFFVLEVTGGSTNLMNLIHHGAKYNPAILDGEWWRLFTSMFLHIGVFHLAMNMIALYYLGTIVERIFGTIRCSLIFVLAGMGGSLTSFAFHDSVSAGASGAIFGLFGALLFFGLMNRTLFQQTMGKNIMVVLLINLLIGVFVPQIDMGAHLGGLISGFLAAAIVSLPNRKLLLLQILGAVALLAFSVFLTAYGIWAAS